MDMFYIIYIKGSFWDAFDGNWKTIDRFGLRYDHARVGRSLSPMSAAYTAYSRSHSVYQIDSLLSSTQQSTANPTVLSGLLYKGGNTCERYCQGDQSMTQGGETECGREAGGRILYKSKYEIVWNRRKKTLRKTTGQSSK